MVNTRIKQSKQFIKDFLDSNQIDRSNLADVRYTDIYDSMKRNRHYEAAEQLSTLLLAKSMEEGAWDTQSLDNLKRYCLLYKAGWMTKKEMGSTAQVTRVHVGLHGVKEIIQPRLEMEKKEMYKENRDNRRDMANRARQNMRRLLTLKV